MALFAAITPIVIEKRKKFMSHKICYLSSEITPFASAYSLGKFSRKITSLYHEAPDLDIRLMMPKYGFISERKYILREVIRLKDIPTSFGAEEKMVNLKSKHLQQLHLLKELSLMLNLMT